MHSAPVQSMREAHTLLAEISFSPIELKRGYAGRYLRIDLSHNAIDILPVTQQMKDLWIGGKGFDLWLTFKEISAGTKWDSPENPICFSSGPLGGTAAFPGSGKTLVTAISPQTFSMMDCNVGGYFGPFLKFAGFDALVLIGKASEETICVIDSKNGSIRIETAPMESIDSHVVAEELTEMYADDEMDKRNIAVVSAGRAASHARIGCLNFSFYDWRRRLPRFKQAGRGGIGRVFRDKKLKALVLKSRRMQPEWTIEKGPIQYPVIDSPCVSCSSGNETTAVQRIAAAYGCNPDYVNEMLQDIQDEMRYISKSAITELGRLTGIPRSYLFHIATSSGYFSLTPKGKHEIKVCMGNACKARGSENVLEAFERELGIRRGETTSDLLFSIEGVPCLGCCNLAPAVRIGHDLHGGVQQAAVGKLLKKYRDGGQV